MSRRLLPRSNVRLCHQDSQFTEMDKAVSSRSVGASEGANQARGKFHAEAYMVMGRVACRSQARRLDCVAVCGVAASDVAVITRLAIAVQRFWPTFG